MSDSLFFDSGNQTVKSIFVSSTFRDMQFERDAIAAQVLPELSEFAAQYGAGISFTDLRWGIATGELDEIESARKVLSVCLDEIDASKPYMLVLLGDRYGWIPDRDLLEKAAAEKGYLPGDFAASVTALEIEYGALSQGRADRCLFYFRQMDSGDMTEEYKKIYGPEDPQHEEKQHFLKERIEAAAKGRVRRYRARWDAEICAVTGLEELCAMICADVRSMMEADWGKIRELSWQERSAVGFGLFLREKASCCAGRETLIEKLRDILAGNGADLVFLRGASGDGKSTVMAALAQRLHRDGLAVFPFFCGGDARSATYSDMLRQFIYYLESALGQVKRFDASGTATRAELTAEFRRLLRLYGESGRPPLILMADALDRLLPESGQNAFSWLPLRETPGVRFIVSSTPDIAPPENLTGIRVCVEELGPLAPEGRREVIRKLLGANRKELDDSVVRAIESLEGSENPLYLSAVLRRLVMLDSRDFAKIEQIQRKTGDDMKGINEYLTRIAAAMPKTVEGVLAVLLREAGERINAPFVSRVVSLLAASRYGLRISDLEGIFAAGGAAWSSLDFARLKKYMRGYFIERPDGRIHFSHRAVSLGLAAVSDMPAAERGIFDYLKTLPENDPVRIQEIVYHAWRRRASDFLGEYLSRAGETALNIAAAQLRQIALYESSSWVLALFAGQLKAGNAALSSFLVFNYSNAFDDGGADRKILRETLLSAVAFLQNFQDPPLRRSLLIALNRLAALDLSDGEATAAEKRFAQAEKIANELARAGYAPPPAPAAEVSDVHISADAGTAMLNTAAAMEAQGRLDEALGRYKALMKISRKMARKFGATAPRRDFVTCCERIGTVFLAQMKPLKALKYYRLGFGQCAALIAEEDTPHTRIMEATLSERMGNVYKTLQMYDEAEKMYRQSLEQTRKLAMETGGVKARSMLCIAYGHLGALAELQGQDETALAMFREELRLGTALAEESDTPSAWQNVSIANERIGNQQMKRGERESALESFEKSMEISRRLAEQSDSPTFQRDLAMGYHKLGTVYSELERDRDACSCFECDEEISGRLANQLGTPTAFDEWAVSLYTLAVQPSVPGAYRFSLLTKAADIWERLYRQTRRPDFYKKLEMCRSLLQNGR